MDIFVPQNEKNKLRLRSEFIPGHSGQPPGIALKMATVTIHFGLDIM